MKSKTSNKVTLLLGGKPMIVRAVELLSGLKLSPVVVVVGFAKESVKNLIQDSVVFAEQKKRLGTAHALTTGIKVLPKRLTNVLVIQGDDSAFYKPEALKNLINSHLQDKNALTFLTIEVDDPSGLGRIIRDKNGRVSAIIEEKNASAPQKEIKEINPACYVFNLAFLKKYLSKVRKDPISGEYYLVDLVKIALANGEKVKDIKGGAAAWRGVNTKEELEEAEGLYSKLRSAN